MEMCSSNLVGFHHRIEYLGEASTMIDSIMETVEQIPVFRNFTYREIKVLTAYMQCYGVAAGEEIITEGRAGDYLVLLLTGEVHLLRVDATENGVRKRIATAGPGTVLGELSMLDGQPRLASCVAVTPTDFAMLDRDNLNRLFNDVPELSNRFLVALMQVLAGRMRETCDGIAYPVPRNVA